MSQLPINAVAYCPIKSQNDYRNVCVLTDEALIITTKGISKTYLLSNVVSFAIKQKKMLFPVVAGGIIGSLFFVASFNFVINFWLSLSLSSLGFVWFYYGWQGSPTISIKTKVKEYDHFINAANQPLRLFIDFISQEVLPTSSSSLCFYITLDESEWSKHQQLGVIGITQKTYLKTKSKISSNNHQITLRIVVNRLNTKVAVEIHDGQLRPFVTESINLDAVELMKY